MLFFTLFSVLSAQTSCAFCMVESFQHKRNLSVKNKASFPLSEEYSGIPITRWSRTQMVSIYHFYVLQPHLASYTAQPINTRYSSSVWQDDGGLWAISRVKSTLFARLSKKETIASLSLDSNSKYHGQLSVTNLLMQATPLRVLWGISAQWRALQEQSKCSLTHTGISLENKQTCSYSTLFAGWLSELHLLLWFYSQGKVQDATYCKGQKFTFW